MDSNPYATPTAELETASDSTPGYYVVSPRKFTILMFATMGLYTVFWFYAHWRAHRRTTAEKVWPVARAIFNIFFTHALFRKIQESLASANTTFEWSPQALATTYVVLSIGSNVVNRLPLNEVGSPYSDLLGLLFLVPTYLILLKAQRAANLAVDDSQGEGNSSLTPGNYIWILIGALLWLLAIIGIAASAGWVDISA